MKDNNIIAGRNPVIEALKSGRQIEKIMIAQGTEGSIKKIVAMAGDLKVPVHYTDKNGIDRIAEGMTHQGVCAYVAAYDYCDIADILRVAQERDEPPFVILLDNLEDPHNLGAIMRTAECCGAHGVVIPARRSAGLTDTAIKASAGAAEYIKCAKVQNMSRAIEELQAAGLWIAACDMGDQVYYKANLKGPIGLVIGSEGAGISRLVRQKCDFVVSIPMIGKITSLNASNAAAILMYEIRKQRDE